MNLLVRIFLENLSNSRLGFRWAVKIRHSWWRIRKAPRLFTTHWAGLMISAWPGFVSELRAHCLLFSRPRWAADGPAAAQRLLSPAPFVLHLCSLLYARPSTSPPFFSWEEMHVRCCHQHYDTRGVKSKWLCWVGNFACAFYAQGSFPVRKTTTLKRGGELVPLFL